MDSSPNRDGARRTRSPNLSPEHLEQALIPVLDLFFGDGTLDGKPLSVEEIAARVSGQDFGLTREQVYRVIGEARRQGYILYLPPRHLSLQRLLRQLPNAVDVHVPNVRERYAEQFVPAAGGDLVYELMKQVADQGGVRPVHIAFGIGRSTMRCVQRIAERMRADVAPPRVVVHAMAAAFSMPNPLDTPLAALASLVDAGHHIEFVHFPAPPVVPARDYEKAKKQKFLTEAFQRASEIDIVITSLASAEDEHGYLRQTIDWLAHDKPQPGRPGWVGDVHLRPYGVDGPIPIKRGLKPMTLFELEDLVALSQTPGKHVVLLVAPCGSCHRSKAPALSPLLRVPSLRVCNHMIVDAGTAAEALTV